MSVENKLFMQIVDPWHDEGGKLDDLPVGKLAII